VFAALPPRLPVSSHHQLIVCQGQTLKGIRLIAMIALLTAGLSSAGDYAATNRMPEQIHFLMETEGYGMVQKNFGRQPQSTNSLRNLQVVGVGRFIPLELLTNKPSWSLWNNSSVRYVGRYSRTQGTFDPATALSQFEYRINYSFVF
jgi:hypothetical protein